MSQTQFILSRVELDRSRHAAPQISEILRNYILNLQLVPQTVLSRAELSECFGVSLTPIRDALLSLSAEGLVDIYPQHATTVSKIDIRNAKQAHFLRRSIELEVVRSLAQHHTEQQVYELEDSIALQEKALERNDWDALSKTDKLFHQQMHRAARVEELWQLQQSSNGHLDRLRRLHLPEAGKAERIIQEHKTIVQAIKNHDVEQAEESLRHHLSETLSHIPTICQLYPDYIRLDS